MSINWKNRFKKTFKARLVIAGLIFAAVGWFLLGVMFFGRFFEEELLEIEEFFEESYPIIFYIPPSFAKRLDEIIAEAKRFNFDLLAKKAEDLKNEFFKRKGT